MFELYLLPSGLQLYSKCRSQECYFEGGCLQCVVLFCSSLSKQRWVRSDRWPVVAWPALDAITGGAETPTVSNWYQTFSNRESGATPGLRVALGGDWAAYCSGLQSLLKPICS